MIHAVQSVGLSFFFSVPARGEAAGRGMSRPSMLMLFLAKVHRSVYLSVLSLNMKFPELFTPTCLNLKVLKINLTVKVK